MKGRPMLVVWILRAAALLVPPLAVVFARLAGASWLVAIGFGALATLAVYLSSRAPTDEAKAADLGRGIVVSLLLTIAVAWVHHQGEVRSARQDLAFTLSGGRSFEGIDLHGRDLARFYIARKDLTEADLRHANLHEAILRDSTLGGADLRWANLSHADLRRANLKSSHTDLRHAQLQGADLSTANMEGVVLAGANLRDANLTGAHLRGADLRGADLRGAILTGADLRLALLNADLRGAVLAADYRNAQLTGVGLQGARWDDQTRWPPGFDPLQEIAKAQRRSAPPPIPSDTQTDSVVRVVDGDTVQLKRLGGVRLLGIDAPQTEIRPRDCYGSEASDDVAALLPAGTQVHVTLGRPDHDGFERVLAYLWLSSGRFVNEEIVERGDARVLITQKAGTYEPALRAALVRAATAPRGLWKACGIG
jgi:uncharacterized protein YjbI with pentapeptide repeats/endonuclease YncB( thermonuclease family)